MGIDDVRSAIARRTDVHLDWLRTLCRIPGVSSRRYGIDASVQAIRQLIEEIGGKVQVLQMADANPVIFAEFDGDGERTLLFYNHYDIQPAEPLDEWTVPPFEGVVEAGLFYARGAADNKGDLVSVWRQSTETGLRASALPGQVLDRRRRRDRQPQFAGLLAHVLRSFPGRRRI